MRGIAFAAMLMFGQLLAEEPGHPRYPRILLFTAAYCQPCQAIKNTKRTDGLTDLEWLRKAEWRIDESDRAHLQIIDLDKCPDLTCQFKVTTIPTLILIGPDGKERGRSVYAGRETFGKLLDKLKD